jgi:hypothetical protein
LVARPLWERKVVGSNPATPTTGKIALWESSRLPLLCKMRARVSDVPGSIREAAPAAQQNPKKSATKETEP